jgi:hypothetical protein
MKTENKFKANMFLNNAVTFLIITFLMLFVASKGFCEESKKPNSAMQAMFKELKKGDDSSMVTFLIIGGVGIIVGFAMYMSFKGDKKPKAK